MKKERLAQVLTYAGTLPFFGAAIIPIIQPDFSDLNYNNVILTYGAVIVSFIAGIHWGAYLFKEIRVNLFIHSNIIALLAWIAVVTSASWSGWILILCFSNLLFIDIKLYNTGTIEPWYFRLRTTASLIVISTIAIHIILQ